MYRTGPSDEPGTGHDEIVAGWLESADVDGRAAAFTEWPSLLKCA